MKRYLAILSLILLAAIPAYATVNVETTRVQYSCDGVLVTYAYPFQILEDDDLLAVKANTASGTETTLVLNTDYTVTGAGAGTSGGNLVLTAASKCGAGYTLTLLRNVELTQDTDYVDGEVFSAESFETALDKMALVQQQQDEEIGRSLKVKRNSTLSGTGVEVPIAAGRAIGWNSTGTGITNYATSSVTTTDFDNFSNYGNSATAAVAAIGGTEQAVVCNTVVTLSSATVIPATMEVIAVKGCAFTLGNYNLTVNGAFNAGDYQVFSLTGTGKVVFGSIKEILPEWYGAVSDGSLSSVATDNYVPFTHVLNTIANSTVKTVRITGRYYIGTTLVLLNAHDDIKFIGNSVSRSEDTSVGNSVLISDTHLFEIGSASVAPVGETTFVDGVAFDGITFYELNQAQTKYAIRIYSLAWGLTIRNCKGIGWAAITFAENSPLMVSDPGYVAYHLSITWSAFRNNLVVVDTHANSYINTLIYEHNLSHYNTAIIKGAIRGASSIAYNNLEGTAAPAIVLRSTPDYGYLHLTFKGNYFEANTGAYLAYLVGSSNGLHLVMEHNVANPGVATSLDYPTQYVVLGNTREITLNDAMPVVFGNGVIGRKVNNVHNYSIGIQMGQTLPATTMISERAFAPYNFNPTYQLLMQAVTGELNYVSTPYGMKVGENRYNKTTPHSTSFNLNRTLPINTLAVATVLLRYKSSATELGLIGFYDTGSAEVKSSQFATRVGDFYLATIAYQSGAATKDLKTLKIWPFNAELTSGTLTVGQKYLIINYVADDDFTNVGGSNVTGNEFTATGTTPTHWAHSSRLRKAGEVEVFDATYYEVAAATNTIYPYMINTPTQYTVSIGAKGSKTGIYDFSSQTGSQGDYILGTIPDNARVTRAWYEVQVAPTSGGAATIAFGVATDDASGILAPTAYNGGAFVLNSINDADCTGAASSFTTKTTAERNVILTIAGADLTAGKIRVWWEYIIGE